MRCPPRERLQSYVDESLPSAEREAVAAHLAECSHCRQMLTNATQTTVGLPTTPRLDAQESRGEVTPNDPVEGSLTIGHEEPGAAPGSGALPAFPGYETLAQIGRGGMGVVCKARHVGLNRIVAIKMLSGEDATAQEIARLRQEAQALAQLQHPHIVQIFEVGAHEGRVFFTMEFCSEGSLAQKLAVAPLPHRQAAALLETLARAVQAAHERQIIHRDLKPGNILLAEGGIAKIADFGLAKRLDSASQQTQTGVIMGTPSYMAPEQARGETRTVGPAADVYALGAILYETLTGRAPFKAATLHETVFQVVHQDPLAPTAIQPALPRDLETICMKCLEKRPEKRYTSARDLAEDLRRYLDGMPIVARPAGLVERSVKWMRRHPATTVAWTFLVVSIALLTWALFASNRALDAEGEIRTNLENQSKQRLQDERDKQIMIHREEIKRAQQSGNWRDVLTAQDAAVKLGYALGAEDRLSRAEALMNLYRHADAQAELDRASPTLTTPDQRALRDLYRANLLWFDDDARALELMRQAIPNLRQPAEKAYAQGLTAAKIMDAIAHFRAALAANRLHAEARKSLAMCLVFVGELDEARAVLREGEALTPDDPGWLMGFALLETLKPTKAAGADDHPLKLLRKRHPDFDPDAVAFLEAGLAFLPQFAKLYRAEAGLESYPPSVMEKMHADADAVMQKFAAFAKRDKNKPRSDARLALKFHPAITSYLAFWTDLLPAAARGNPDALQRLRLLAQDHPEATLRTLVAHLEFMALPGAIAKIKPEDSKRVSALFQEAYEGKGIHDVRSMALDGWIAVDGIRGSTNVPQPDRAARAQAAANVAVYLRQFGNPAESRLELYFKVCRNAEAWGTARLISDLWLKAQPGDVGAFVQRAKLEAKAGAPAAACAFAKQGLLLAPNHKELRDIERTSSAELRKLLEGK